MDNPASDAVFQLGGNAAYSRFCFHQLLASSASCGVSHDSLASLEDEFVKGYPSGLPTGDLAFFCMVVLRFDETCFAANC